MNRADPSPAAVMARLRRALARPGGSPGAAASEGAIRDGETVRARLRRSAELRRLALALGAGAREPEAGQG